MASKIKVDQIQTIDGTGTIALQNQLSGMTSASMPTGSVLQVVQAVKTDRASFQTGSAFIDTGLSCSITPSSTSSKILISTDTIYKVQGSARDSVAWSINNAYDNQDSGTWFRANAISTIILMEIAG